MRRLHPVGPREKLVDAARYEHPDGVIEESEVHAQDGDRLVVRVAVRAPHEPATVIALWHLTLGPERSPERVQLRLMDRGRRMEAALTFFPGEALVWRRGAEPASQAVMLPPAPRLLWPPFAGRDICLAGLAPSEQDGAESDPKVAGSQGLASAVALLRRVPTAEGGVVLESSQVQAKLLKRLAPKDEGGAALILGLESPELGRMRAELDDRGLAIAWHTDKGVVRRVSTAASAAGSTFGQSR